MHLRRGKVVGSIALLLLAAVAGSARADDPPGNNGTVKVNGVDADDASGNEAHVGCAFQIEFRGYDQGDLFGTATFDLLPPSGDVFLTEAVVPIGEDPAGGAPDLDAVMGVDLFDAIAATGAAPQGEQGFHVKLTVAADGSIGADAKHKTLWVTCEGEGGGGGTPG